MWKHPNYLNLDFMSDALQAGDLIGHLNWHVQGELSEGKKQHIEHSLQLHTFKGAL